MTEVYICAKEVVIKKAEIQNSVMQKYTRIVLDGETLQSLFRPLFHELSQHTVCYYHISDL